MQKGIGTIYILVILALLVLAGSAGYAIASTPQVRDETSDWKTYRNEKYGFEFKYPLNFYVLDRLEEEKSILLDEVPIEFSEFAGGYFSTIDIILTSKEDYKARLDYLTEKISEETIVNGEKVEILRAVTPPQGPYDGHRDIFAFFDKRPIVIHACDVKLCIVGKVNFDFETVTKQILSTFKFILSEDQLQILNIESKESVEYTTPGGISPPLFRALQWLATFLIIGAFIFRFRPHPFKIIFPVIFTAISLMLLNSCFITDASLPQFCEYRAVVLPVFIFTDPLGDNIPTVVLRNIIMPIATPLIAFGVWYIIGSFIFIVYEKFSKRFGME